MKIYRLLVSTIAMFTAIHTFAEDYEVKLCRPSKVGLKYELTASFESSSENIVSSKDKVLNSEKVSMKASLQGVVTITKIDKKKQTSECSVVVTKLTKKENGSTVEVEVLAKGTLFTVKKINDEEVFQINNKSVDDAVAIVLKEFFSISSSKYTDDDIFGTKDRKVIGDSWPINSVMAAAQAQKKGISVDPKQTTGNTSIIKKLVTNGKDCLQVRGTLSVEDMIPPLPATLILQESKMTGTMFEVLPIDTTLKSLFSKHSMNFSLVAKTKQTPNTPVVTVKSTMKNLKQATRKFLK